MASFRLKVSLVAGSRRKNPSRSFALRIGQVGNVDDGARRTNIVAAEEAGVIECIAAAVAGRQAGSESVNDALRTLHPPADTSTTAYGEQIRRPLVSGKPPGQHNRLGGLRSGVICLPAGCPGSGRIDEPLEIRPQQFLFELLSAPNFHPL